MKQINKKNHKLYKKQEANKSYDKKVLRGQSTRLLFQFYCYIILWKALASYWSASFSTPLFLSKLKAPLG